MLSGKHLKGNKKGIEEDSRNLQEIAGVGDTNRNYTTTLNFDVLPFVEIDHMMR